jgi:transposase
MRKEYKKYTQDEDDLIIHLIVNNAFMYKEVAKAMDITTGMVAGRVKFLKTLGHDITTSRSRTKKSKKEISLIKKLTLKLRSLTTNIDKLMWLPLSLLFFCLYLSVIIPPVYNNA